MRLRARIEALEGDGTYVSLGTILDAIDRKDRGEAVDWDAMRINPRLAEALDAMDDMEVARCGETREIEMCRPALAGDTVASGQ